MSIVEMQRAFQFRGISCPLVDGWRDVVGPELQKSLRQVLERPHTLKDLSCYARLYQTEIIDLGETGEALAQEIQRLAPRPPQQ
jgi:hypothetical protein